MYNILQNAESTKMPYEAFYKLNVGLSLDEFESERALLAIFNEKDPLKRMYL